jgi:uncharacterized delta-60 repeat protein
MRIGNYFRVALIALVFFALAVIISACGKHGTRVSTLVFTFSVSGTVTEETGEGLAGVMLTLIPGGFSTVTNANGEYSIDGLLNGNYVLTPSLDERTFEPASRDFSVDGRSLTALDFTAIDESLPAWVHTWGGDDFEWSYDVSVDGSGDVYVAGGTASFGPGTGALVVLKYSSSGELLWKKTWGGSDVDCGKGVSVDGNGDVYVAGRTFSFGAGNCDVLLLKYSPNGTLLRQQTWGGSVQDEAQGVSVADDGSIFVTGETASFGAGSFDVFILKYSPDGNLLWKKTWGGTGDDYGMDLCLDDNGNIYLTGYTDSFHPPFDLALLKYSPEGELLWQKTWGGSSTEGGCALAVDGSGSIFVTGSTNSFGEYSPDVILLKYSADGEILWQQTWGGTRNCDWGEGICVDDTGKVYITGVTERFSDNDEDLLLLEYSTGGELLWQGVWGRGEADIGNSIAVDRKGRIYIAGQTYHVSGYWITPAGITSSPDGIDAAPSGVESQAEGTETEPDGIETVPEGVEDEDQDRTDILVMKIDPSDW